MLSLDPRPVKGTVFTCKNVSYWVQQKNVIEPRKLQQPEIYSRPWIPVKKSSDIILAAPECPDKQRS